MVRGLKELVEEASAAPIAGWDFSWLDGRATEERPSWGYRRLVADRVRSAELVVDLQSGGGEVLSELPSLPKLLVATEGWQPNLSLAADNLQPRGISVVATASDQPSLPFRDGCAELVGSRHPIVTWWDEIARILRPEGSYLSQQVGPHSVGELTEFFMGRQPTTSAREPRLAQSAAESAGLQVVDLRAERLKTVFYDVGAVVYFLRLVVWIVPDFTVERYWSRLRALHDHIEREGAFIAHASRFLIEARKPSD
jgi:SAM-dependent methyltransferase